MNEDQQKLFPGTQFISTVIDAAETKRRMTRDVARVYVMRSAMAGFIIGVFYLANYAVIAAFTSADRDLAGIGRLAGAIVFGFALSFIFFTKSELLTSNMMVTTIAVYFKRMRVHQAALILALCYAGNFLGGVVIAMLVRGSSLLEGESGKLIIHAAETKIEYVTAGPGGMLDLFIRAVFCNFLINIAMLLVYNGLVRSDGVKVVAMNVAVMLFAFLGFEHSVANTVLFSVVGLNGGLSIAGAAGNIVIALAGNFVGGGLLIGWYYAYVNDASHRLRVSADDLEKAEERLTGEPLLEDE